MRERFAPGVLAPILLLSAVVAAACGPASGGSTASPETTEADVTITADALAFDTDMVRLEAGEGRTIRLVNLEDPPHNVAIYVDESASRSLFVGELISRTSTVYRLPPLEPGTYHFRCDLHPEMKGSLLVEG
jgi:plastocyanin